MANNSPSLSVQGNDEPQERSTPSTANRSLSSLPAAIVPGIQLLVRAYDYSRELGQDPWQWSVEINELGKLGLSYPDLRWLTECGLLEHGAEYTVPADAERVFRKTAGMKFSDATCFAATDTGIDRLRTLISDLSLIADLTVVRDLSDPGDTGNRVLRTLDTGPELATSDTQPEPLWPSWDPLRRQLWCGDNVVKRFRVPAPNQELVLTSFHEEGWPVQIDDPLPRSPGINPSVRLQSTIKSLNRKQICAVIQFHGNGTGTQVYWERLEVPDN